MVSTSTLGQADFIALEDTLGLRNPHIVDIRGRGLFLGLELDEPARPYCEALMNETTLTRRP